MRSVEQFIARRYLLSRKNVRFINIIAYVSIGGIAVGVAALFIALSVFNGFSSVVSSVLLGFDPHLRIEKPGGLSPADLAECERIISLEKGVSGTSPFVSGKAMLVAPSFNRVVYLRGVDKDRIGSVSGVTGKMILGEFAFADSAGADGIVIGLALADHLSTVPGNDLMIISPYGFQSALSGLGQPQTVNYRVTGIYESNNKEYDGSYAFISVACAQKLFNMGNSYSGIEMRLDDLSLAEAMKERLSRSLPGGYVISTWYDLHKTLYRVMGVERWTAYALLALIIVVASFNMLGSLTMGVMEKKRDIAVLKTMGMPPGKIVRVFMAEGILIGVVGTLAGMLLGMTVVLLQMKLHIFPLDTTVYIINAIPVEIHWLDCLSISAASLGLSWLAAYYPARRAAGILPAEALRWE